MRFPDPFFGPAPLWLSLALGTAFVALIFPGWKAELRHRLPEFVLLLLIGLGVSFITWRSDGGGHFFLNTAPAIAILIGRRAGIAAALLITLLVSSFHGLGAALPANLIAMAFISWASGSASGSYAARLPARFRLLAPFVGTWFAYVGAGAIASFVVPLFGRALWGVFGQGIALTALWTGLIEGAFTALLLLAAQIKPTAPAVN